MRFGDVMNLRQGRIGNERELQRDRLSIDDYQNHFLMPTRTAATLRSMSRAIGTESTLAEKRRNGGKVLVQEGDAIKELIFTR